MREAEDNEINETILIVSTVRKSKTTTSTPEEVQPS